MPHGRFCVESDRRIVDEERVDKVLGLRGGSCKMNVWKVVLSVDDLIKHLIVVAEKRGNAGKQDVGNDTDCPHVHGGCVRVCAEDELGGFVLD